MKFNQSRSRHIGRRKHRIAERTIGPLRVRTRAAEPEDPRYREDIEKQNSKDNIVEQIAVAAAEREQNRPHALQAERKYRRMRTRMERSHFSKEQAVERHRIVDARAR